MPDVAPAPYRRALRLALSSALFAAFVVAPVDAVLALGRAPGSGGGGQLLTVALGLVGAFALVLALFEGVVAGAVAATHADPTPAGLLRRLRADAELDRRVVAALLAGAAAAVLFALFVAFASLRLVAKVERQGVGALLLGGGVAAALPLFYLLAYPALRVTRRLARLVPRLGPLPATLVLVVAAVVAVVAAGVLYVTTRLDWRVLRLGPAVALLDFFTLQVVFAAAAPLRRRLPARLGLALRAAAVLVVLGCLGAALHGPGPGPRAAAALDQTRATRPLVGLARRLLDRDHDGYAAVLGGGDCDDRNPSVHPGAVDVPDNGVDENCLGGDAHKRAPATQPATQPATAASAAYPGTTNVVVIAIDTVRADRLGVEGYRREGRSLTPRLDELAARGVRFRRLYAQAPNTPRSFPSIFTSRFPSQIGWDNVKRNYATVLPENETVWEALARAGVRTIGFSSHHYFTEEKGAIQGFTEYDNTGATSIKDSNTDTSAPRITPRVVARLRELAATPDARFALFVHFAEPHSTYMTHPEFPIKSKGVAGLEEKYDYEIAFVDRYVGEVIDAVDKSALARNTVVIVFSDHAEAFGAHTYAGERLYFHGQTLYDELLRVPLIAAGPGLAPRVVEQPVMLLDLAPTLLALFKLPAPPSFQGRSLLPAVLGDPLPPAPVFAELLPANDWTYEWRMMIDGDGKTKLIYKMTDNLFELFDLEKDPGETHNLAAERPADLERMKKALAEWMEGQ